MSSSKHVIDVARRKVVSGLPNDSLQSIAKSMVDHWITSVVIVEAGKPVGIVTDGIIFRLIAKGHNPLKLMAKDVMAHPVETIHEDVDLEDAEDAFRKSKVSRLVIVNDKGQVKGIVSKKDVDRFAAYSLAEKLLQHRHEVMD
ncbi:MAG: CBS domain-containing protein [Promethearchaeota archaeon]